MRRGKVRWPTYRKTPVCMTPNEFFKWMKGKKLVHNPMAGYVPVPRKEWKRECDTTLDVAPVALRKKYKVPGWDIDEDSDELQDKLVRNMLASVQYYPDSGTYCLSSMVVRRKKRKKK